MGNEKREQSLSLINLAAGWLAAIMTTIIGTVITSALICNNKLDSNWSGYGAMVTIMLAAIFGASYTLRSMSGHKLIIIALFALGYWLILLAVNVLLFHDAYTGVGVTILLISGGSAIPAIIGIGQKKAHKHFDQYGRYR